MTLRYERFQPKDLGFEVGTFLKLRSFGNCLPKIVTMLQSGDMDIVEGKDHTSFPEDLGTLIIQDGETRRKMEAQGAIPAEEKRLPFESFNGVSGAENYIRNHYDDGAFFVDGREYKISLVGTVIPSREIRSKTDTRYFVPPGIKIGSKATSAVLLPLEYDHVRTTRVSSTPRGSLKIGSVEGYGPEGLDSELELIELPGRKQYAITPEFLGIASQSTDPQVLEQLALLMRVVPVFREYENRKWENPVEKILLVDRYGKMSTVPYDSKSPSRDNAIHAARPPLNFRDSCDGMLSPHEHPSRLELRL